MSARLYYVIGASGVGKDSIMRFARQALRDEAVVFAHRYITRPVELAGENHIQLCEAEFTNRLNRGCFKFHWYSHQLYYGIGKEVDMWLDMGLSVVINGSREYLPQALALHPDMIPVVIQVDNALLKERLIARGRETLEQIEERLQRAQAFAQLEAANKVVIENNHALEQAGQALVDLIRARQ